MSWRLNKLQHIDLSSPVFSNTSFSFCWTAQPEPSAGNWFLLPRTATNRLQLTEPVCGTGLYNCLTSICFLWVLHLHPIQPVHSQGYALISSTGCICYLHGCISYLRARPRVNMQHNKNFPFINRSNDDKWTLGN